MEAGFPELWRGARHETAIRADWQWLDSFAAGPLACASGLCGRDESSIAGEVFHGAGKDRAHHAKRVGYHAALALHHTRRTREL